MFMSTGIPILDLIMSIGMLIVIIVACIVGQIEYNKDHKKRKV